MTREEILNMPAGREMDVLIAETVLCLQVIKDPLAFYVYEGGLEMCLMPFYSIDIKAAWDVVEKIVELSGADFTVGNRQSLKQGAARSCIAKIQYGSFEYDNPDLLLYVVSDTAPLAICRAALLAVIK